MRFLNIFIINILRFLLVVCYNINILFFKLSKTTILYVTRLEKDNRYPVEIVVDKLKIEKTDKESVKAIHYPLVYRFEDNGVMDYYENLAIYGKLYAKTTKYKKKISLRLKKDPCSLFKKRGGNININKYIIYQKLDNRINYLGFCKNYWVDKNNKSLNISIKKLYTSKFSLCDEEIINDVVILAIEK